MIEKERLRWLDISKGIAIILMIIGHMDGLNPYVRGIIFSFHMPLFMIINGYLIKEYNICKNLEKSCKSLLIPYAITCTIQAILSAIIAIGTGNSIYELSSKLIDMVVGISKLSKRYTSFGSVWLVWFLVCLFLTKNIYVMIMSKTEKKPFYLRCLILISVSVSGYLIGKYYAFMPWSLDVALYSVIFIATGDFIHRHKYLEKWNMIPYGLAFLVWCGFLATKTHIELATRKYPFIYGGAICAIAASVIVLKISKVIDVEEKIFPALLAWFGRSSLLFLAVHCLEMRFMPWKSIFSIIGISGQWILQEFVKLFCITIVVCIYQQIRQSIKN